MRTATVEGNYEKLKAGKWCDFGRKLGKVKSREMVLSEKMMLSELASSSFFHLSLTIFLLCYFELFPVTGAGINLFLLLRIRESGRCILLYFGRFLYYQPVREIRIKKETL